MIVCGADIHVKPLCSDRHRLRAVSIGRAVGICGGFWACGVRVLPSAAWSGVVAVAADNVHIVPDTRRSPSAGPPPDWTVLSIGWSGDGRSLVVRHAVRWHRALAFLVDGSARATGRRAKGAYEARAWFDFVFVVTGDWQALGLCGIGLVTATGSKRRG